MMTPSISSSVHQSIHYSPFILLACMFLGLATVLGTIHQISCTTHSLLHVMTYHIHTPARQPESADLIMWTSFTFVTVP